VVFHQCQRPSIWWRILSLLCRVGDRQDHHTCYNEYAPKDVFPYSQQPPITIYFFTLRGNLTLPSSEVVLFWITAAKIKAASGTTSLYQALHPVNTTGTRPSPPVD
jgi:hypothetical protein